MIMFVNEVIHPLLCYGKGESFSIPDIPEGKNVTRDFRDKEVYSEYISSINIPDHDSKKKEIKRLSEAFSNINNICSWKVDIEKFYRIIRQNVIDNLDEISIYLSKEDIEKIKKTSENSKSYKEFVSLLLISVICYIPNVKNDAASKIDNLTIMDLFRRLNTIDFPHSSKIKNDVFLFELIFENINRNMILNSVNSFLINIETFKNLNSFENKFIGIEFIDFTTFKKRMRGLPDSFTQTMPWLHLLYTGSLCDIEIIQRGFIVPEGKIDRRMDEEIRDIEKWLLQTRQEGYGRVKTHQLCIGRFKSIKDCINAMGPFVENAIIVFEISRKAKSNIQLCQSFEDVLRLAEVNNKPTLLGQVVYKHWINYSLSDGMICWILNVDSPISFSSRM
ncbi:hypothetical protein ACPTFE_08345 [Enterococcus faecalis]|uniref:hypothetical protein n=1 Tax=Enterococcus faecalis TaxID=1351 RepID=UPI00374B53CE